MAPTYGVHVLGDSVSNRPFDVVWDAASRAWRWKVPFDVELREVSALNADAAQMKALACVGWHVLAGQAAYCPTYRKLSEVQVRGGASAGDAVMKPVVDGAVVIVDRMRGRVTQLVPALSVREAVVSWFVREVAGPGNGEEVLCLDTGADGGWYVERLRPELLVTLGADGREVASGEEGAHVDYQIALHANAVMRAGD